MSGVHDTADASPYALLVAAGAAEQEAGKDELLQRVRELEQQAVAAPPEVAVACLQDGRFLTPATRSLYEDLARRGSRVRIFGHQVPAWVAPGVEGVALDEDDPLVDQWTVLFVGAEQTVCLAAQDQRDDAGALSYASYAWAQTSDPEVVRAVARRLGAQSPAGEDPALR